MCLPLQLPVARAGASMPWHKAFHPELECWGAQWVADGGEIQTPCPQHLLDECDQLNHQADREGRAAGKAEVTEKSGAHNDGADRERRAVGTSEVTEKSEADQGPVQNENPEFALLTDSSPGPELTIEDADRREILENLNKMEAAIRAVRRKLAPG